MTQIPVVLNIKINGHHCGWFRGIVGTWSGPDEVAYGVTMLNQPGIVNPVRPHEICYIWYDGKMIPFEEYLKRENLETILV